MKPLFISGIGTQIGKTVVAALVAEGLQADYWKPVQAGYDGGTDSTRVASLLSNTESFIHPETYLLQLAASPHIAARHENCRIELGRIRGDFEKMNPGRRLIIEGAGGLMVPLNESEFVYDLVKRLDAKLILVSRNYLGSINHSLMTAEICRAKGLDVAGWIFNDQYMNYESEISRWSGYPTLFSLPLLDDLTRDNLSRAAGRLDLSYLCSLL
jgi:dethiobiotin synthetase